MGREARARCQWKGESGTVTALLESHEIILRGDIRGKIARASITAKSVEGDCLILMADGEMLRLDLGASEAAKWLATLSKPRPTLAQKLGVAPSSPTFVLGETEDAEMQAALAGATAASVESAAMIIAILVSETDLAAAVELARANRLPDVTHVKGSHAFTRKNREVRHGISPHLYPVASAGFPASCTSTR